MRLATVLLIGGDDSLRKAVRDAIASNRGCRFAEVADVDDGISFVKRDAVGVAVIYVNAGSHQQDAIRFLEEIRLADKAVPAVIVHETLDPKGVLQLLQQGAAECLGRPLNISRLSLVLDMLLAPVLALHESERDTPLQAQDAWTDEAPLLPSPCMQQLMDQVHLVAPLDTTILITGETGTGKTRLSRFVHQLSPRRSKRFVAVNCGALSPTLVESELFGHTRGAFTGADRDHSGKFAQCQDGTLLLDEIDTMSLDMQVKFLRVVEERVFEALGSDRTQRLQARLIVASNRSLEDEAATGRFRSDLYYRLNVVSFQLPPLRQRREEIEPLAETFVTEFAHRHGLPRPRLGSNARRALEAYDWPGNVRQLRNVIERAVILSPGDTIDLGLLPQPSHDVHNPSSSGSNGSRPAPPDNKLAWARSTAERTQLHDALRRNDNNRSKTAADLGISRVALYKRLRKFQMI